MSEPQPDRDRHDQDLIDALDSNREIVEFKLAGLTLERSTAVVTPSGVTLLGLVTHLTAVERDWFEAAFLGLPIGGFNVDESFRIAPSATMEGVMADYRRACDRSRAIVAQTSSLEVTAQAPHWFFGIKSLRWILIHMLRETARHAGHLDILRELTDGATGYG